MTYPPPPMYPKWDFVRRTNSRSQIKRRRYKRERRHGVIYALFTRYLRGAFFLFYYKYFFVFAGGPTNGVDLELENRS